MNERFSIVIPVYNREQVVGRTLCSIAAQTYRPLHVILVDNASTDGSLSLMKQWAYEHNAPDFQVTVTEERKPGAAAARNKGLSFVHSDCMLFFDSDDILMPDAVSLYVQAFKSASQPDIVMSRVRATDTTTGRSRILPLRGGDKLRAHIHHSTLRTQGYAARTALFRKVGAWNEQTRIWDDWELGIRLLLATNKVAQIPDVVCEIIISGESITGARYSDRVGLYEAPLKAAEKVFAQSARPDAAELIALMDYRRMMLAAHFAREGARAQAHTLKAEVLRRAANSYPLHRRLLLCMAYTYIRCGGRGFDRLLSLFF